MTEDKIRILRLLEYTGPRSLVEQTVERSIQGTKSLDSGLTIKAVSLGTFPEILAHRPGLSPEAVGDKLVEMWARELGVDQVAALTDVGHFLQMLKDLGLDICQKGE